MLRQPHFFPPLGTATSDLVTASAICAVFLAKYCACPPRLPDSVATHKNARKHGGPTDAASVVVVGMPRGGKLGIPPAGADRDRRVKAGGGGYGSDGSGGAGPAGAALQHGADGGEVRRCPLRRDGRAAGHSGVHPG
ncbi:uncharacterized protein LOC119303530 [Triticum dicoccoides]|uniref:uncharacterized protein LOC119303530 n=1 Tax=Triticum dicoccoides TaxID=85692 RepID=UPI0018903762|nr:uncharacterized protein LOC119303530 [Triticum dicoccoides]